MVTKRIAAVHIPSPLLVTKRTIRLNWNLLNWKLFTTDISLFQQQLILWFLIWTTFLNTVSFNKNHNKQPHSLSCGEYFVNSNSGYSSALAVELKIHVRLFSFTTMPLKMSTNFGRFTSVAVCQRWRCITNPEISHNSQFMRPWPHSELWSVISISELWDFKIFKAT